MPEKNEHMVVRVFRFAQVGVTGDWLLALYPLLLWVIVGVLSGYGFQEKGSRI